MCWSVYWAVLLRRHLAFVQSWTFALGLDFPIGPDIWTCLNSKCRHISDSQSYICFIWRFLSINYASKNTSPVFLVRRNNKKIVKSKLHWQFPHHPDNLIFILTHQKRVSRHEPPAICCWATSEEQLGVKHLPKGSNVHISHQISTTGSTSKPSAFHLQDNSPILKFLSSLEPHQRERLCLRPDKTAPSLLRGQTVADNLQNEPFLTASTIDDTSTSRALNSPTLSPC